MRGRYLPQSRVLVGTWASNVSIGPQPANADETRIKTTSHPDLLPLRNPHIVFGLLRVVSPSPPTTRRLQRVREPRRVMTVWSSLDDYRSTVPVNTSQASPCALLTLRQLPTPTLAGVSAPGSGDVALPRHAPEPKTAQTPAAASPHEPSRGSGSDALSTIPEANTRDTPSGR